MDNLDGFDLDRSVQRAWREFRERLADHIAKMADDEYLILNSPEEGQGNSSSSPYIQFCGFAATAVRCEVSSNAFLDERFMLSPSDEHELTGAGWHAPADADGHGSGNFYIDLERDHADQASAMAVGALRDVLGIAHPTFLQADAWDSDGPVTFDVGRAIRESPLRAAPALPEIVHPEDHEELSEWVDRTLAAHFDKPLIKDDDGDIPVRAGSALVFVRVKSNLPVVEIFAPLVKNITNRTRAAEVLSDLNRDKLFAKFFLNDDYVIARITIPAAPFVPEQLRDMLAHMSRIADQIDEELTERLGGQLPFFQTEPEPNDPNAESEGEGIDELAPELMAIIQLEAEGSTLSASEVASICGHDRDKILGFIRECSQQEIDWRKSAETAFGEGDREEAEACEIEAASWAASVSQLRAALRIVVVGDA